LRAGPLLNSPSKKTRRVTYTKGGESGIKTLSQKDKTLRTTRDIGIGNASVIGNIEEGEGTEVSILEGN